MEGRHILHLLFCSIFSLNIYSIRLLTKCGEFLLLLLLKLLFN
ncbi:hypothetical protein Leryth_001709, partial [Lithospermum erythrorhizon]